MIRLQTSFIIDKRGVKETLIMLKCSFPITIVHAWTTRTNKNRNERVIIFFIFLFWVSGVEMCWVGHKLVWSFIINADVVLTFMVNNHKSSWRVFQEHQTRVIKNPGPNSKS